MLLVRSPGVKRCREQEDKINPRFEKSFWCCRYVNIKGSGSEARNAGLAKIKQN